MKATLIGASFALLSAAALAGQAPQPARQAGPRLQATQDPGYAELIARCKTPPAARGGGPGGGARAGGAGGAARAGGPAPTAPPIEYTVSEIPGVIAAGQRWRSVWNTTGNNADGIVGTDDGGLLIAQNDNGAVVKLDAAGNASVAYADTNTGGALSMNAQGVLFVAERGLNSAVRQLAPQRRIHADSIRGDSLNCLGGVLNDVSADSKGGVYFTMGGLFYADAKGVVTAHGQDLQTNGVILSPDEKTLYVTNQQTIAAFDVQPDGSLTNQRVFAKLPAGGGDGLAVDAGGRLYVTVGGGGGGANGLYVFAADGTLLGHIPSPRNLITVAFGGPDKKTLFAVANDRQRVDVYSIPMIAQGYKGRAK